MVRVSVIIPVYNSPTVVETVHALLAQTIDLDTIEVLVVGLDELGFIEEGPLVRFIPGEFPYSPARNRNIGMKNAHGEFICLLDADCVPASDWLDKLMQTFQDPAILVVGGGVIFQAESYWAYCDNVSWFYQFLADTPRGERPYLPSLNLSLRRTVYTQVGGFSERYPFPAGEDTEWTMRLRSAGYTLFFEPDAVVYHKPERSQLKALWSHGYRFGRYSIKNVVVQSYVKDALPQIKEDKLLPQRWWLLAILSPFLAAAATMRVAVKRRSSWQAWAAIPGIWLSKFAWCMGNVHTLRIAKYGIDGDFK